jgi:dTDP-4-amino-4,6-dideoxygalactose transaminase
MTDLARLHAPLRDDLLAATARVLDSGRFILGEEVQRFEHDFARSLHAQHAVGCASGTDALVLALLAAGIGPGARVVCPAYSFFATASTIVRVGAQPVFADIDPTHFDLDVTSAEALFEDFGPIDALVVADLFGRAAPMARLRELAERFGVPVIEDAAQAVGARDEDGGTAGARSRVGCFSFYPTKNLGALGDAGILVTDDAQLADRARSLRAHGAVDARTHDAIGLNSRLDALQAALLGVKLPYLEKWSEARRAHAASYQDRFRAMLGDSPASGVRLPPPDRGTARHVFNQFVVQVDPGRRDALRAHLDGRGIDSAVYYARPLHQQPALRGRVETPVPLEHAEAACERSLALPMHPDLRSDEIDRVVEAVCDFMKRSPAA